MRAFAHSVKITSSVLRVVSYRCCSNAKSSRPSVASAGSADEFDEFVESVGRDVTDLNKGLTFSRMLRQSKFVQLGDFAARLVTGRVTHRVQDDLYIDFGLKFNAVCKAPSTNSKAYREGAVVLLRLHDPELSERFLGSGHDLTLLEADATLIRLLRPGSDRGIDTLRISKNKSVGTAAVDKMLVDKINIAMDIVHVLHPSSTAADNFEIDPYPVRL